MCTTCTHKLSYDLMKKTMKIGPHFWIHELINITQNACPLLSSEMLMDFWSGRCLPLSWDILSMPVTLIFLWLYSKFLRTHQNKHGDGMGHTTVKDVLQETVCFSSPLIEFAWCLNIHWEDGRASADRIMHSLSHPSQWSHSYSELCKVYMYSIIHLDRYWNV